MCFCHTLSTHKSQQSQPHKYAISLRQIGMLRIRMQMYDGLTMSGTADIENIIMTTQNLAAKGVTNAKALWHDW